MCRYEPIKNYSVVGRFVGGKHETSPHLTMISDLNRRVLKWDAQSSN